MRLTRPGARTTRTSARRSASSGSAATRASMRASVSVVIAPDDGGPTLTLPAVGGSVPAAREEPAQRHDDQGGDQADDQRRESVLDPVPELEVAQAPNVLDGVERDGLVVHRPARHAAASLGHARR